MPLGIYLLFHDEIRGPAIKCSYFATPLTLPQEFVSKLYMSHAGFGSSSIMEMKYEGYRNVSLFTGHVARKSQKEGILGILFEENENFDNLDLFLQRNLNLVINYPENLTLEFIYHNKLLPFLELNRTFKGLRIEQIPEILIFGGNSEYRTCLLHLGVKRSSNQELVELFQRIQEKHTSPQYQYIELKSTLDKHIYLVFKAKKSYEVIKILAALKPYLDAFFFYALEILALFLIPTELKILELNKAESKKDPEKGRSILQFLQKTNYNEQFNKIIRLLIRGEIILTPFFAPPALVV